MKATGWTTKRKARAFTRTQKQVCPSAVTYKVKWMGKGKGHRS